MSRVLYLIKLTIFANKGTKDENSLNKCVALYNKIKKIDMKEERDKDDETIIRRYIKIFNLSLKVDESGNPVNIGNKELQSKMLQLSALQPIQSQNLGEMRRFLKETEITLFYGIKLSFFLKKCKHEEVTWQYLLLCYHITQILVASLSDDPISQTVMTESTDILEQILIRLGSLERKIGVNKLMSKDVFLNNTLVKPNNTEEIHQSKEEVKRLLSGKGIREDSVLFKLVDKIGDKLEDMDQDGGSIFTKLRSVIGEISLEMRSEMTGDSDDIKSQIAKVIEMFKEVSKDSKEMAKMPEDVRAMYSKITEVIPTDPNEKISEEKAQELQSLFGKDFNDFSKNMAKTTGADPAEIKELEEMIKRTTPDKLTKACCKFKL